MQYRGANIRLLKQPDLADVRTLLTQMQEHGANAVAFNTIHYCYLAAWTPNIAMPPQGLYPRWLIYPDIGQDQLAPWSDTVDVARVYAAVQMALDLGYERVLLKPMTDSRYGAWRGFISVKGQARAFASDYKNRLLAPYIPILKDFAPSGKVDLCMGTELYTVTKELGAEFWLSVVKWLRWKGVKNRLTYAANWGWAADAEYNRLRPLWPALDYVGIDAYWPMCNQDYTGPVTRELLLSVEGMQRNMGWSRKMDSQPEWCPRIDADIVSLAVDMQKPVWFTEIGYPNTLAAAVDPMGDRPPMEAPTDEVQRPLWEAARAKWEPYPLEGWLAWEAAYGTAGVPSSTHNLIGTPLADVAWRE